MAIWWRGTRWPPFLQSTAMLVTPYENLKPNGTQFVLSLNKYPGYITMQKDGSSCPAPGRRLQWSGGGLSGDMSLNNGWSYYIGGDGNNIKITGPVTFTYVSSNGAAGHLFRALLFLNATDPQNMSINDGHAINGWFAAGHGTNDGFWIGGS